MLQIDEFRAVCEKKTDIIKFKSQNKNIWIYGAGKGGEIVREVFAKKNINICGFFDKNSDVLQEKFGLPVKAIETADIEHDFVIVSLRGYETEIVECLKEKGFQLKDIYYIVAGELNKEDIIYRGCKVGRYTYGYEELLEAYPIAESIGRFCSINGTARIWNNHPIGYITTHPILDNPLAYAWEEADTRKELCIRYGSHKGNHPYEESELRNNSPIVIGNDVWIGANVCILPGVKIGDGAILAAGAVITKDIPDYAVAGGVPAKVIKYRFSRDEIKVLKKVQWWNWSIEKIEEHIEEFYQPEVFIDNNY